MLSWACTWRGLALNCLQQSRKDCVIPLIENVTDVNVTDIGPPVGKSASYISDISSGKQLPTFEGLFKLLCDYFGITPAEFFDDKVNDPLLVKEFAVELQRLCGNDLRKLLGLLKIMESKHMEAFLDYAKKVTRYGDL